VVRRERSVGAHPDNESAISIDERRTLVESFAVDRPRGRRRRRGLLLIIVAVVVGVNAGAGAAAGPVPADDGESMSKQTLAEMRRQEALRPAVVELEAALRAGEASGFAGLGYDSVGLTLYWKGPLPVGVTTAVDRARRTGPVHVRPAAFSRAELWEEAGRISTMAGKGSDLQEIVVPDDGSGLLVTRMPPATAGRVSARAGRALAAIDGVLRELAPTVPVTLTTATAPIELTACPSSGCTRRDDTSPWNGGGYIRNPPAGYSCTSGFGVWAPGYGEYLLIGAAHCGSRGDYFVDYAGERIGSVLKDDWDRDVLAIRAPGYHWIWDGGPNTRGTKSVRSWGYRVSGELLCRSGMATGTVCNIRTDSGSSYTAAICDSDGDCFTLHDLARATQIDGVTVAAPGDSGGPVFSLDGSGVRAKGTVSARARPSANAAYTLLYYQDMDDIVDRNNFIPRTS
jgi:streptogrisin D